MNENSVSSPTVMQLLVNSNRNSSTPLTAQHSKTNGDSVSNSTQNSDQALNWKSDSITNLKQNNITDLNFKAENLQQISTNALPPYVPGSPINIVKSADGSSYEFQCCTDCGDTFALKSSLEFHLERRSVLIKFPCDACKSVQIFYNRCTLLSHIRSHTDKNETADIEKAVVNPLPRVFMDGLQSEFVNALDEELPSMEDATPVSDLLEFSLKEMEDENNTAKEKSIGQQDEPTAKVKCLDCNEEFNNSEERAEHITQNDKIPVIVSQCNKCGMICPSKCFLKAHQRIHLQISPYVCPECGESPSPMWMNFQFHVKFKCFHNARSVGYKCPVCKSLSPSNDALLKHMESHTEKYAKCDSCPRAYMNIPAFNAHIQNYHPSPSVIPKYNMIYKCSLCDVVFLKEEQMLSHRSSHLKEQICEYVFNCMQCGKPLESKNQLMNHIKISHPKIYKHITQNSESKNKSYEPVQNDFQGKAECMICNLSFRSHQGYSVHLAKAHININTPCGYCNIITNNRIGMINHGKKHLNKGSFLCLLCSNKKLSDDKDLDSHLMKHVERLQYCAFCPICDEVLKTYKDAMDHLREEHMLFDKIGTSMAKLSAVGSAAICHFCRDSFANQNELRSHLFMKHQVNGLKTNPLSTNEENKNEHISKKPRIEGNVCAKCNYHSLEREDFKKHILTHKINKSTSQCQECGLCFVVEPALVKHLRVVHKISDTKKYIEEEGTNSMPDFENHTEVSTCNSLICSVCFTTFPNESSLKTHMRSHGMAFIRASKSTSSTS